MLPVSVAKVDELKGLRRSMLVGITKDMQKQVTQVLDLKEMVVGEMLRDRSLMVSLFQRCGKAEFKFLVNRYGTIGWDEAGWGVRLSTVASLHSCIFS